MRIESVRIENFRGFSDETVLLDDYSCFVGRNGSGKSTVLYALNVFFRQFRDTATDLSRLTADDFHHRNTESPIQITVTFCDMTPAAQADLSDYVRQGKLTVSAEAAYDSALGRAPVLQYGSRLGMEDFRKYFEADKAGQKAAELKQIFATLREKYPDVSAATSKADMAAVLNQYEAEHPDDCVLIRSEDQFYGATRGANRLEPHIQWVFVPATKDYAEEANEAKDSALGQLLARTVRMKADFSGPVAELKDQLVAGYEAMLVEQQGVLDGLSTSLEARLQSWAHPAVTAKVMWNRDAERAVRIEDPSATIQLGERGFKGELPRFGHGLQRAYLLTLLQELSSLESETQPTLVMAIEEPEIYQHPPQARHLAEVLRDLAAGGDQILCCTHSPLFIPGDQVEAVRLVRDLGDPCCSAVTGVKYSNLAARLEAAGEKLLKEEGMLAKLYPNLNPVVNEMFFCGRLILVEGIEDLAHITAYLSLRGLMSDYRSHGCHIVPVGGKSELLRPLAIALEIGIPVYVVWDADTDKEKDSEVTQHKKENRALQVLLGVSEPEEWPADNVQADNYCMWKTNLTDAIRASFGDAWTAAQEAAATRYGQPGGLQKNPVAIAYAQEQAWNNGARCSELETLTASIVTWASNVA